MTWGRFKAAMTAKGVQDYDEIRWIDVTDSDSLDVSFHDAGSWEESPLSTQPRQVMVS